MVDFQSGYVPPGVYVATQSTGSTGVVGIGNTVVCLLGRAQGFQTYTETITFANGDNVQLAQLGIDPASVVVTGVVAGVQTTFVIDGISTPHDYSLSQTDGFHPDSATTVVRTDSGTIPTTGTVTVAYNYVAANYFALNSFTEFSAVVNLYGPALDPDSGAVVSPITLAAQIAFQNGANLLYAVALTGNGSMVSQFAQAYTTSLPNYDINLMVPLFEDAVDSGSAESELNQLVSFLTTAEGESIPRMAIVGLAGGFSGTSPDVIAQSVDYRRVVLTYPQQFTLFNNVLNQTVPVDGFYFAAACAGFLANNAPNQPLTRAQLRSFNGIPAAIAQSMTQTNKNLWSSRGVTVAEINRLGQLIVRHGVTTDVSDSGTREISIVRCQDALFEILQITLDAAELIGSPITANTPLQIKALVAGALEAALANNTIQTYTDLLVSQESIPSGDPTVIDVTFTYSPTYPLNYITVTFTLDLSTGNLADTTSDTAGGGSGSTQSLQNVGGI